MIKASTYRGTSQRAVTVENGMKGCMEWVCEMQGERAEGKAQVAAAVTLR